MLSSGSWPFQQSVNFSLPSALEPSVQRFTTFYSSQHSGRKLLWLYHMSKGELVTNCFKNRYTLQASTLQMAVLLQYNVATSWSATQLSEATGIKMDLLLQVSNQAIIFELYVITVFSVFTGGSNSAQVEAFDVGGRKWSSAYVSPSTLHWIQKVTDELNWPGRLLILIFFLWFSARSW